MFSFLKNFWSAPTSTKNTLDEYLADKNVETVEQLEFWQKEFAQRERDANKYIALGNYNMADWIRHQY